MRMNSKRIAGRALADMLLAMAAFFLPWWVMLLFAAALFFLFDAFVELFFAAFLIDLLYGSVLPRFLGFEFALSLGSALLYLLLTFLKRRMIF